MNPKAILKSFLPQGNLPRRVKSGAFRGLKFKIDTASATQFWFGLAEREIYSWLRGFVSDAISAVDVGAAAGEFAILFLSRKRINRVLAFDPAPELAAQFSENLHLNGFDHDSRLTRLSVFLDDHAAEGVMRLDDFTAELEEPVVLKIDVDGAELSVLRGAEKLLRNRRTRIILETHSQSLETECSAYLESVGFKTRVVKNAWWRILIKEQRPIGFNRWLVASNDSSCTV